MLADIIEHINCGLIVISFLNDVNGLAELLQDQDEEKARKFPALYTGSGNYAQIDMENAGTLYHRLTDKITFDHQDSAPIGCAEKVIVKYPLRAVCCVDKAFSDKVYTDDELAMIVGSKIINTGFKDLKKELKASFIRAYLKDTIVDRYSVWKDEYENVDIKGDFKYAMIAVNYFIELHTYSNCLTCNC